jgi:hypothetical protein
MNLSYVIPVIAKQGSIILIRLCRILEAMARMKSRGAMADPLLAPPIAMIPTAPIINIYAALSRDANFVSHVIRIFNRRMIHVCQKIFTLLFIATVIPVISAQSQLQEQNLGYAFENPGFLSISGSLTYDSYRHRLAIADEGRNLIYIFDLTDRSFRTIGENREMARPLGMAFDKNGSLFITQEKSPLVLKYQLEKDIPDTLNLSGIIVSDKFDLRRLYIDNRGFIYLINFNEPAIYIIDSDGKPYKRITDNLKKPDGIKAMPSGEIVIADKGIDPILIFSRDGEFRRRLSRPESPTSKFSFEASGLASDQRGWIYTLNMTKSLITWYDPTGVNQTEWAPPEPPFFPKDLAIDRYDNIYVSEKATGSVRVFSR